MLCCDWRTDRQGTFFFLANAFPYLDTAAVFIKLSRLFSLGMTECGR